MVFSFWPPAFGHTLAIIDNPTGTRHRIQWLPDGRLLESALFYAVWPPLAGNPGKISVYGYRHWYEGGGCWSDTYFKITHDLNQSTSHFFLCENPDADELTDTAFRPTSPNAPEDKLRFQYIYDHVADWVEWSDEKDCMVLKQTMIGLLVKRSTDGEHILAYSASSVEENDPIFLLIEKAFAI